jgi:hypothetical protein
MFVTVSLHMALIYSLHANESGDLLLLSQVEYSSAALPGERDFFSLSRQLANAGLLPGDKLKQVLHRSHEVLQSDGRR